MTDTNKLVAAIVSDIKKVEEQYGISIGVKDRVQAIVADVRKVEKTYGVSIGRVARQ
jgi:hypothetical protein